MSKRIWKNLIRVGLLGMLCFLPMFVAEAEEKQEEEKPVVVGTPTITSVKSLSYQSVEVTWERMRRANGYLIYRSKTQDGTYERVGKVQKGTIVSYIDEGLSCGRVYYYKVRAYRKVEEMVCRGDFSEARQGLARPDRVRLQQVQHGHRYVKLTWDKSPKVTGYEISRSVHSKEKYEVVRKLKRNDVFVWTDKDILEKKAYDYRIRPYKLVKDKIVYGRYSNVCIKATTSSVVAGLKKYVGRPYRSGGTTPNGWDCSGFTQWVYREKFGIEIPRNSGGQSAGGVKVDVNKQSKWKPGDILVFASGGRVNHVGIYLGNNQMIHALSPKYDTLIQEVDYYDRWDSGNTLVGVRRYL